MYSIGELAKIAGVSTRTIRFYDEKNLLCPCGYSEGRYRLYDDKAIIRLQEILMLKYIGVSLENISQIIHSENKVEDSEKYIEDMMDQQIMLLERKQKQMESVLRTLRETKEYGKNQGIDLNHFTDIMHSITNNERYNQRFDIYDKYNSKQNEWSAWRWNLLELESNMKILDAGFGYGMIWIQNWRKIPEGCCITAVDKNSKGMDFFKWYYNEHRDELAKNIRFEFIVDDLESREYFENEYDRVIANHIWQFIKARKPLAQNLYDTLKIDGIMLSTISAQVNTECVRNIVGDFIGVGVLNDYNKKYRLDNDNIEKVIQGEFDETDKQVFNFQLIIDNTEDLYHYLYNTDDNIAAKMAKKSEIILLHLYKTFRDSANKAIDVKSVAYQCRKRGK